MKTHLVMILDRSGSMSGLESDTIGGYNAMLKRQKEQEGECVVTTVLFDDEYELLYDALPLEAVKPLARKEYYVRGCTALLDAVGKTILAVDAAQSRVKFDARADKVVFVITTDGLENASREFTAKQVKRLVDRRQKEFGWEFLFLGANIDAVSTARELGVEEKCAVDYLADEQGTQVLYSAMCEAVSAVREGKRLSRDWKAPIEQDWKQRRKKKGTAF